MLITKEFVLSLKEKVQNTIGYSTFKWPATTKTML